MFRSHANRHFTSLPVFGYAPLPVEREEGSDTNLWFNLTFDDQYFGFACLQRDWYTVGWNAIEDEMFAALRDILGSHDVRGTLTRPYLTSGGGIEALTLDVTVMRESDIDEFRMSSVDGASAGDVVGRIAHSDVGFARLDIFTPSEQLLTAFTVQRGEPQEGISAEMTVMFSRQCNNLVQRNRHYLSAWILNHSPVQQLVNESNSLTFVESLGNVLSAISVRSELV